LQAVLGTVPCVGIPSGRTKSKEGKKDNREIFPYKILNSDITDITRNVAQSHAMLRQGCCEFVFNIVCVQADEYRDFMWFNSVVNLSGDPCREAIRFIFVAVILPDRRDIAVHIAVNACLRLLSLRVDTLRDNVLDADKIVV
jgi:hypothetical protein